MNATPANCSKCHGTGLMVFIPEGTDFCTCSYGERKRFENWYVSIADLNANPVGSRICHFQFAAWQAARAAPSPSLGEPMVELEVRNDIVSLKHTLAPTEQFYDGMKLYASPTAAQEGESQKQRTSELEEWVLKHPGDAAFELANYRYELAALRKKSGAQVYEALKQIVDGDTDPAFGLPATKGLFHEAAPTWMQQAHIALEEYETSLAAAQGQKAVAWRDGVDWPHISKIVAEVIDDYELECEDGAVRKLTEDEKTAAIEVAADLSDNEDFHRAYAVASPVPASGEGWVKCSERMPENGKLVFVFTPGEDGGRLDQDYREEGAWGFHANSYEHYIAVGGSRAAGPDATCTGPSEDAPYTHWMPLPAAPKVTE